MNQVYLGIGGNIGNKHKNFQVALQEISRTIGPIIEKSSVYESDSWGFHSEDKFWNLVVVVATKLEPIEILWRIQQIEDKLGRERTEQQYSSRTMDIDILYFNDDFMESKELIIPHPKMYQRKFVLVPLNEIAPDLKHPLIRLSTIQLLEACKDESIIRKLDIEL